MTGGIVEVRESPVSAKSRSVDVWVIVRVKPPRFNGRADQCRTKDHVPIVHESCHFAAQSMHALYPVDVLGCRKLPTYLHATKRILLNVVERRRGVEALAPR